jgi:prepilin-type N-terminal cleavage/methylation domain-containing protein/prepilin-type processing-associated H-X9-DG protein
MRVQQAFSRRVGFTLIELLVVIAIIAILASILFPVFARARENARRSSCQSNEKQIGLAMLQYTQDYDEKYPQFYGVGGSGITNWSLTSVASNPLRDIQPYMKSFQIYYCPSVTTQTTAGVPEYSNYLLNGVLFGQIASGGEPAADAKSLSAVQEPSTVVMCQEYKFNLPTSYVRPWRTGTGLSGVTDVLYVAHFDGSNLLFSDGHVKWRKQNSITARDFGLGASGSRGATQAGITAESEGGFPVDGALVSGG